MNSPLYDFEQISSSQWNQFREQKQIPDVSLGEIAKGWMFCDINCGILGIIKSQSEEFIPLAEDDGTRIGQFKLRNHHLVFED